MKILNELSYANENKNALIDFYINGYSSDIVNEVTILNNNKKVIFEPKQFSQFTLKLDEASVVYPNIIISKKNELIDINNGYTTTELVEHKVNGFPITRSNKYYDIKIPDKVYRISKCVYLSALGFANFLLGEAPRLEKYNRFIKQNFKVILHGNAEAFHFEILKSLGLSKSNLICIPQDVAVISKEMIHVTPTYLHNTTAYNAIDFLKTKLKDISNKNIKSKDRVYLSRAKLGINSDRYITNENDFENFLIKRDFEIIYPEKMTVVDQINACKNADILISPFGSAWSNCILRKPNSKSLMLGTKFSLEYARLFQYLDENLSLIQLKPIKYRDEKNFSKSHKFTITENDFNLIENYILK